MVGLSVSRHGFLTVLGTAVDQSGIGVGVFGEIHHPAESGIADDDGDLVPAEVAFDDIPGTATCCVRPATSMGPETQAGCVENKAVHAIFPGGCAVLAATKVEKIEAAEWKDLGMPETLWVNGVREFGPLIISIDTKDKNLIEENKAVFNAKKKPILERINAQIRFIK